MVTNPLLKARGAMIGAGAQKVPDVDTIQYAPNGTEWTGLMANGVDTWVLYKNRNDSYNATF